MNKACLINFDIPEFKKLSPHCVDLLREMLQHNPKQRVSAIEALQHEFFGTPSEVKMRHVPRMILALNQQQETSNIEFPFEAVDSVEKLENQKSPVAEQP